MLYEMTATQKEKFINTSGYEYDGMSTSGSFTTEFPYSNKDWKLSPWNFTFEFNQENGHLICKLSHRMTNNRIYGWHQDGLDLDEEIYYQVYTPE
jgi:hypothetical protein